MADIFISYAREERKLASLLSERFACEGWTVFWDHDLLAGDNWEQRIEDEATRARCVVALWSEVSVESAEVRKEAVIGRERGVLVPAFLAPVKPPSDFRKIHASDLAGWDGSADTPGLLELIHAIACLIGRPAKTVTITPVDFVIVAGSPKFWPALGPTVNLTCRFGNAMKRPVTIHHMEASASGPGGHSYRFVWNLLYDTVSATEHQWRQTKTLEIPELGFRTGIQFRANSLNNETRWPGGSYKCQIKGWADRADEAANLRTEFEVSLPDYEAEQVKSLLSATEDTWEDWYAAGTASNHARGVRARIGEVRTGLPVC